jgi:hypothetical protein
MLRKVFLKVFREIGEAEGKKSQDPSLSAFRCGLCLLHNCRESFPVSVRTVVSAANPAKAWNG